MSAPSDVTRDDAYWDRIHIADRAREECVDNDLREFLRWSDSIIERVLMPRKGRALNAAIVSAFRAQTDRAMLFKRFILERNAAIDQWRAGIVTADKAELQSRVDDLESRLTACRAQRDNLAEEVAALLSKVDDPIGAAHAELISTLQLVVAAAGGKVELGPEHRAQCNAAFLAAIPTLSGGLMLVNAVQSETIGNGKEN